MANKCFCSDLEKPRTVKSFTNPGGCQSCTCQLLIFDRFHRRDLVHIPDGCAVGQQHGESGDAVADAAGGGHANLHGVEEVLIGVLGLFVALLGEGVLGGEALALVDGIVELGVGVAHLPAVHEELKALGEVGIRGLQNVTDQHFQNKLA